MIIEYTLLIILSKVILRAEANQNFKFSQKILKFKFLLTYLDQAILMHTYDYQQPHLHVLKQYLINDKHKIQ